MTDTVVPNGTPDASCSSGTTRPSATPWC